MIIRVKNESGETISEITAISSENPIEQILNSHGFDDNDYKVIEE